MKIAILVPFYKFLPSASAKCLIDLAILLRVHGIAYSFVSISNTYLHEARETLFELFEKERSKREYDWILHIDSDQTFSVEQVVKLLRHAEENGFPILSGIYFSKAGSKITPVLMRELDEETRKEMAAVRKCRPEGIKGDYYRIAALPDQPFFEVDAAGLGFMACRPKVYDDIRAKFGKPVFALETNESGDMMRGEDVVWCRRARACNYKIMVDREITVGHMGAELGYADYLAWLSARQKERPGSP